MALIDERLRMHAGGIELVGQSPSGEVRLRFTGMCTGCPYKPLTMANTVRPALARLAGVERIDVDGSRISEEAQARLDSLLGVPSAPRPTPAPDQQPGPRPAGDPAQQVH